MRAVMETRLAALLALASAACAVKVWGGAAYSSKALLVDGLTSIANIVALVGLAYYYSRSKMPADEDHPFGHGRLSYGGIVLTMLAYAFVAGLAVSELVSTRPYAVKPLAPVAALIGLILYLGVIAVARSLSWVFGPYSFFTLSEVLESLVVLGASAAGTYYSYMVDYAGGLVIAAYLFYELRETFSMLVAEISDMTPPPSTVERIRGIIVGEGLVLRELRLRMVTRDYCTGEATVWPGESMSLEEALEKARRAERRASCQGCSLVIRVCPRRGPG